MKGFPIYKKTHRSGNQSWIVSLGTVNGRRQFRSFATKEQAEHFRAECIQATEEKRAESFNDLTELARAKVRVAIEKLKPYEADINDAADFFIKYAKPPNGKITIQEAMELFAEAKRKENLSEKYIGTALRCFFAPFRDAFNNRIASEVTFGESEKYLYSNKTWSPTTRNTHNRHLRALYSFLIKRGHAGLNPFASVEFAKKVGVRVIGKIISPEAVRELLQYALDNNNDYKAECASMVLVFFCGVRVDEVDRLDWKQIRLDGAKSIVDIQEAKNGRRRINPIPINAVEWLRLCEAKGKVAPPNYTKRMQRLRKKAKVNYPQNAARHCFASYHIAYHRDGAQTAFLLGHPNPKLLYDTYRELVSFEEAEKFWNVVPESSRQQQAELERQRDELAKEEAEMQSNIGLAERSETGHWVPVMDEDASYSPDMEEVLANL